MGERVEGELCHTVLTHVAQRKQRRVDSVLCDDSQPVKH